VAQLSVTDGEGATATATATVFVGGNAPVVEILAPADESNWQIGDTIELRGAASDEKEGALEGGHLRWDATLHHNEHVHPDYFHGEGTTGHLRFPEHGENSYLELCLTATDSVGLQGRSCVDLRQANEKAPAAVVHPSPGEQTTGRILRERWSGLGGSTIADLTASPRYPNQPDVVEFLTVLDSAGVGKDYGERLRGYLHPPVDGEYRFWIASDDSSELWLSSDADPANARLIARVTSWTGHQQWEKTSGQAAAPLVLQASQQYYLEIRHKQADQKDSLSVAWQIPGQERTVIDGEYLSPFVR
jgi:hypothetical protein